MIKVEKEKELLKTISQLFLNKIDEPKGIYMAEVLEFAEELERNLLSMGRKNQEIYLKRIVERFYDWIDETTISEVNKIRKPKTKAEKNLRALVFTVNYAKGCIETNIHRFISKGEKQSEVKPPMLFKGDRQDAAISAFESVVKADKPKAVNFWKPIYFKAAFIAFSDLSITELSQTKFIQMFAAKYGKIYSGGRNVQVDRKNINQLELSERIKKAYGEVK